MFEGEHAHAGGPAIEEPPGARRQPEPAGRDHASDVAAGEGQDVAREVADAGDEAVGAGGDILRGFSHSTRSASISARSPKPANSQVFVARCNGLVKMWAKE